MLKRYISRDNQSVTTQDLNDFGNFPRESFDAIVSNAVSSLKYFSGFPATRSGQTEVTLGPGYFWGGGPFYSREGDTVFNFLTGGNYLPAAAGLKRKVAIVTYGDTIQTDVQDRGFRTDDEGAAQSQSVPVQEYRYARLDLVSGPVAADPQKPTLDIGLVPVAWVTLDNNGVLETNGIEMAEDYRLPSVESLKQLIRAIQSWREQIGQILDTIQSELITVKASIPPSYDSIIADLVGRVYALEQLTRVPANAVETFIERFFDESRSDTNAVGYSARIEGGLQFPFAAQTVLPIALANPLDAKVKTVNGIMLPRWDSERARVTVTDGDAELSVLQYPVHTTETVQKYLTRTVYEYGEWETSPFAQTIDYMFWLAIGRSGFATAADVAAGGSWRNGQLSSLQQQLAQNGFSKAFEIRSPDGETYNFQIDLYDGASTHWIGKYQLRAVQKMQVQEPYWDVVSTASQISGTRITQTFKLATDGWLISVGLEFSQIAQSGDVQIMICETSGDKPNEKAVISRGAISVGNLVAGKNKVPVNPTFLKGGRTYALIIASTGNHFLRTKLGNTYAQGAALYLDDNGAWQPVQNNGDICFELNFAVFAQTRIEVQMQSLELAGGISMMRLLTADREPDGTKLIWEMQRAGKWYQLSEGEEQGLSGAPNLVAFRAVFIGTTDLMPGFDTNQAEVELSRLANAFNHISVEEDFQAATNSAEVHYWIENWNADEHTLTPTLIVGGSPVSPDSVVEKPDPENPAKTRFIADYTMSAATGAVVRTVGETDLAGEYFTVTERRLFTY